MAACFWGLVPGLWKPLLRELLPRRELDSWCMQRKHKITASISLFYSLSSAFESSHRRKRDFFYFCFWHVRDLGMSALFSGARHFLPQMKTKIHPPGWIINNTRGLRNPGFTRARRGWKRSEEGSGERKWRLEEKGGLQSADGLLKSLLSDVGIIPTHHLLMSPSSYCESDSNDVLQICPVVKVRWSYSNKNSLP